MALPASSRRRVWFGGTICGCGLLAIVLPLLRADPNKVPGEASDGRTPVVRGSGDGSATPLAMAQATIQARKKGGPGGGVARNDRLAGLQSDIEVAARHLKDGKVEEFIEDFFPVDELRAIREQTTVRDAARDPRLSPELLKRLASVISLCAKAKPELSQGDGVATFEVVLVPEKATEISKAPEAFKKVIEVGPLPGFGSDLKTALGTAAQRLKEKDMEGFVLGFFPLQEAQHLKSSGELADLLYVIQENPRMAAVMQQDLLAMQQAQPVLTENDTLAEFKLKVSTGPVTRNAPGSPAGTANGERTIRLQLTGGHWRMFDFVSPVRKQINELSAKSADDSPEPIVVRWERLGSRWRLRALDFIEP